MDWTTLMYKSIPGLISRCRIIEYSCKMNCNKHPKIRKAHLITGAGKRIKINF